MVWGFKFQIQDSDEKAEERELKACHSIELQAAEAISAAQCFLHNSEGAKQNKLRTFLTLFHC